MIILPFSPSPPAQLAEKSFEVEIPSSRLQKEAVYRELAEVCEKWGLVEMERSMNPSTRREFSTASTTSTSSSFNNIIIYDRSATASPTPSDNHNESLILTLINTTTSAIRAAQRYFLSLPPEKLGESSDMSDLQLERASHRGIPALGVVTASRPIPRHSTLGVATSGRQAISPERNKQASAQSAKIPQDPLLRLRKVSLATLGALKDMEHRYRLNSPSEQPSNIEDIKDTLGDISITSSTDSVYQNPTFQIEDTSASEQSGYPNSYKGHLYRNDISLRDLSEQAQIVKQWIETVNELLNRLSSEVKTRRIRTKSGNLSQDNVPLPQWATPDCDDGDKLGK